MTTDSPKPPGRLARWMLHRHLDGQLRGAMRRWVVGRVQSDATWSTYYEAQRRAERTAQESALSSGQAESILAGLFDDDDAPSFATLPKSSSSAGIGKWMLGGAGAMAGVAAVVAVWVAPADDGWQARSAGDTLGVRLECVTTSTTVRAKASVNVGGGATAPSLACASTDALLVRATNTSDVAHHLFVVGVRPSGDAVWLAPFLDTSVGIAPNAVAVPMTALARLSAVQGEEVDVHVLFSTTSLSPKKVRALLAPAEADAPDVKRGRAKLNVDGVAP